MQPRCLQHAGVAVAVGLASSRLPQVRCAVTRCHDLCLPACKCRSLLPRVALALALALALPRAVRIGSLPIDSNGPGACLRRQLLLFAAQACLVSNLQYPRFRHSTFPSRRPCPRAMEMFIAVWLIRSAIVIQHISGGHPDNSCSPVVASYAARRQPCSWLDRAQLASELAARRAALQRQMFHLSRRRTVNTLCHLSVTAALRGCSMKCHLAKSSSDAPITISCSKVCASEFCDWVEHRKQRLRLSKAMPVHVALYCSSVVTHGAALLSTTQSVSSDLT